MSYKPYRRSVWRGVLQKAATGILFFFLFDLIRIRRGFNRFSGNLEASTVHYYNDLPREAQDQKIYIVAQFWTSEYMLWDQWLAAFLNLVAILGSKNVYVSVLETGSLDNTSWLIKYLDDKLGFLDIEKTIITEPTSHADVIAAGPRNADGTPRPGWIYTGNPNMTDYKELRRVPFLADLRNRGLEPLLQMHRQTGRTFDKILYLNDVYFHSSDVLSLLATNHGRYDVACGLDFHYPPALYDTFAVRDADQRGPVTATFPYFSATSSREALLNGLPAPVTSCWNGMIAVDAAPYYDIHTRSGHTVPGLRYRSTPDSLATSRIEASECCLIHADLFATGRVSKGMFVNPAARSGYTREAWDDTHYDAGNGFLSFWHYFRGVWLSRWKRWRTDGVSSSAGQNMKEVYNKIDEWKLNGTRLGEYRDEPGAYCHIHETHILIENGWKHV